MKKLLCVVFSLIFAVAVCGCKGSDKKSDVVDLEYYIKLGSMPETEVKLGTKADEIKVVESGDEDEQTEEYEAGDNRIAKPCGNFTYYYTAGDKDKKINYIVSFDGGYGFSQGAYINEVKKTLEQGELSASEHDLEENAGFFFPIKSDFKCIEYSFGKNTAHFIFDEDKLCAVTLYENYGS